MHAEQQLAWLSWEANLGHKDAKLRHKSRAAQLSI